MTGRLAALTGIVAVEFGDFYPGAVCAYHLHLLGATVMLAEPPEGCELRRLARRQPGSGLFAYAGRGRDSVPLAAFRDGQAEADIVIEPAFPTPDAEAALAAHRQRDSTGKTIYVSFREMDGTQHTELTAQAEIGMTAFLGRQEDPPIRVGVEMVGGCAGLLAVQAILAALRVRAITGVGQQIHVPLSRVQAGVLNNVITGTIGPDQLAHFARGWSHPPAHGLPAAGGAIEIMFYGPQGERGFPEFCARIGADAVAADERFKTYAKRLDYGQDLVRALAPWSSLVPRDTLVDIARACGGMAMPKYDVVEAREWEQTLANTMVDGPPGARMPAAPWQVNGVRPTATQSGATQSGATQGEQA